MIIQEHRFVSPAQIKTLVIPIGSNWTSETFNAYVNNNLQQANRVELLKIPTKNETESLTFDPRDFPAGKLTFDFQLSILDDDADDSLIFLSDFEPFRKTYVVIGVVDQDTEYEEEFLKTLSTKYPNIVCHNIVKIDRTRGKALAKGENGVFIDNGTNLENIMASIGGRFLSCLETYYKSYQHVTLRSPGAIGGDAVLKPTLSVFSTTKPQSDANYLQRSKANYKMNTDQNLKSDSRQIKILANFYLLSGQLTKALMHFNEAALQSHKLGDYLWLASSLEGISVCIVLLAEAQYSLPIPSAVEHLISFDKHLVYLDYPKSETPTPSSSERNSLSRVASPRPSNSKFVSPFKNQPGTIEDSASSSKEKLHLISYISIPLLLKIINDKIIHYYNYTLAHPTEFTPQVVYVDTLLRFLQFLEASSSMKNIGLALKNVVQDSVSAPLSNKTEEAYYFFHDRNSIYDYAAKILHFDMTKMSVFQQLKLYVSLTKTFEKMGYHKKHLLFLKNIVLLLLKQKRPIFIEWEGQPIHVYLFEHAYGSLQKSEVWNLLEKSFLMASISLAAMYNDHKKAFEWSLAVLKSANSYLSEFEQIKLLNDYILSSDLQKQTQWFDNTSVCLLKNLNVLKAPSRENLPIKIALEEQKATEMLNKNEALFNPFEYLKNEEHDETKINVDLKSLLVGEEATLEVVLQNPFKFDLSIRSIDLGDNESEYFSLDTSSFETETCIIPAQSVETIFLKLNVVKPGGSVSLDNLTIGVFAFKPTAYENMGKLKSLNGTKQQTEYELIPYQPALQAASPPKPLIIQEGSYSNVSLVVVNKSLIENAKIYSTTLVLPKLFDLKVNKKPNAAELYQQNLLLTNLAQSFKFEKSTNVVKSGESLEIKCFLNMKNFGSIPERFEAFQLEIEYGRNETHPEYKKSLKIPVQVSVLKNLELTNLEILPYQSEQNNAIITLDSDFSESPKQTTEDWFQFAQSREEYKWLLFLDIRNTWVEPVALRLHYDNVYHSDEHTLSSKQSRRFAVPITNKLLQENTDLFIPASKTKSSLFWIRENLIKMVKCSWKCKEMGEKEGLLDLRRYISLADCKRFTNIIQENNITLSIDPQRQHFVGDQIRLGLKTSRVPCKMSLMILDSITGRSVLNTNTVLFNGSKTFRITQESLHVSLVFTEAGSFEINCALEHGEPSAPQIVFGSEPIVIRVWPKT
ncbi:hypothetical protein ACO0QE_004632 [Hanseniaspora vineae]